jgi:predicted DNA-binding transcriptional regulator AlpA
MISVPAEQSGPYGLADNRVMSLAELAQLTGLSVVTIRRCIANRTGPPVTKLSERRIGVRVRHALAWLDARTSSAA